MSDNDPMKEVELQFRGDPGKAVIEGRTAVPFQALVTLILQRKVIPMFKSWGKEPVIVSSELLTGLASAPQEATENRAHQLLVSMGMGVLVGVFGFAVLIIALNMAQVFLTTQHYAIIAATIAVAAGVLYVLMKMPKVKRGEKLVDNVEKISAFLSGK